MSIGIRDQELHALIDNELGETERLRVEAAANADPELAARMTSFRADKERLLSLYGGGLNEPLPREWIARIEAASTRPRWQSHVREITALAACLVLVLTGVIAWRESAQRPRDDVIADALAARTVELWPRSEVVIRTGAQVEAQSQMMARALATRVHAPDLSRMGYRLVAIDSYSAPARSFELRYAARDGRLFTLYFRRSSGVTRFDLFKAKGLRVCIWQDDVLAAVMAGPMSAPEMLRLASLTYEGLTS